MPNKSRWSHLDIKINAHMQKGRTLNESLKHLVMDGHLSDGERPLVYHAYYARQRRAGGAAPVKKRTCRKHLHPTVIHLLKAGFEIRAVSWWLLNQGCMEHEANSFILVYQLAKRLGLTRPTTFRNPRLSDLPEGWTPPAPLATTPRPEPVVDFTCD